MVEEFLPAGEVLEAADALVRVFNRIGNRKNKAKARLKWAIDKIGADAFLAAYRAERDAIRAEGGVPLVLPDQPAPPAPRPPLPQLAPPADGFEAWAADSVRPQKQAGFAAVVIRLILGDITAAQLRAIGAPRRASTATARSAPPTSRTWCCAGSRPGSCRWSTSDLAAVGLAAAGADTLADVTSCPGASSCKLAVTQSRGLASAAHRGARGPPRPGRRRAAASTSRSAAAPTAAASTTSPASASRAASARSAAARSRSTWSTSAAASAPTAPTSAAWSARSRPGARRRALERLLELYVAEGDGAGHAFWAGVPLDRLRALIADLSVLDDADAGRQDFVDLGETKAFEVVLSEGECAA